MIDFLYTGDYEVNDNSLGPANRSKSSVHIQVYCLGDKYYITPLLEKAREKYNDHLNLTKNVKEYLASIPEVYVPQASNSLKNSAIEFGAKELILGLDNGEIRSDIKQIIADIPEFGFDIVDALAAALYRIKHPYREQHFNSQRGRPASITIL